MKNSNKIIGALVLLFAIAYPFLIQNMYPDHYNEGGEFLTYIFTPVLALFGILSLINLKSGVYYSRIVVGSVFIVSGLIKANDTLGFSYKLEEYFEPGALGWSFFEPYALLIAFTVCIAEVILGLALLFGAKYKLTIVTLTGFLVFFGFLTFYTAQCDPTSTYVSVENGVEVLRPVQCVLDCGCFGDALKGSVGRSLTPWESFYKDLVLLILTLFLFLGWNRVKLNNERRDKIILGFSLVFVGFFGGYVFGWWMPLSFSAITFAIYLLIKWFYVKAAREWVIALAMILCTLSFALYTLYYLPVKDYRPYAVGNNIRELKKTSDDFKTEILQAKQEEILSSLANKISAEKTNLMANISDTLPNYKELKDSINDLVNYKYEELAYTEAEAYAQDSMVRGNLLPPVYAVNYLLRNKQTGEDKQFTSIEYLEQKLWNDWETLYTLKSTKTGESVSVLSTEYNPDEWTAKGYLKENPSSFKVSDGYEPKIPADFDFNDEKANYDILNSKDFLILVLAYKLDTAKEQDYSNITDVYNYANEKGYKFYAATSTSFYAESFKAKNNIPFDFLSADEKILKTIVRSNPGMILLKDGVVFGKWSACSMPNAKQMEKYIAKIGQ